MNTLSSQIDALHDAERAENEAATLLEEWRVTVRVLQRDLEKGACKDNHWRLSLRRAKSKCAHAALSHAEAADKLAQLRSNVGVAETIDVSFDESERTYIGPPPAGAEDLWMQSEHHKPSRC